MHNMQKTKCHKCGKEIFVKEGKQTINDIIYYEKMEPCIVDKMIEKKWGIITNTYKPHHC